ncbi:hypothetical protein PPERSA_06254 [Pseudocohnilembus persalinus]|uniref:Uncharacterized protein n=1 Tax=Pseudocohnilembus persalinus TaxID=266149 RepID=A0A0V0QVM0_PSEPJ|nr:hypothetical protein PPERSA_06254 [Pseudocohnilembus persalinus]|eukprot:KRX06283.1 hypothetical protein PPERSA_06254 [Pseudocohnilembus persalinus]
MRITIYVKLQQMYFKKCCIEDNGQILNTISKNAGYQQLSFINQQGKTNYIDCIKKNTDCKYNFVQVVDCSIEELQQINLQNNNEIEIINDYWRQEINQDQKLFFKEYLQQGDHYFQNLQNKSQQNTQAQCKYKLIKQSNLRNDLQKELSQIGIIQHDQRKSNLQNLQNKQNKIDKYLEQDFGFDQK